MTTVFRARPYGRFVEIKSTEEINFKDFNFLGDSFSNTSNVRGPIQFRRKDNSKDINSNRVVEVVNPKKLIFKALKSTSQFQPQSSVPCRSDSSSEANSGRYQKSDA